MDGTAPDDWRQIIDKQEHMMGNPAAVRRNKRLKRHKRETARLAAKAAKSAPATSNAKNQ
jgi:hypothetical protein